MQAAKVRDMSRTLTAGQNRVRLAGWAQK